MSTHFATDSNMCASVEFTGAADTGRVACFELYLNHCAMLQFLILLG
jgi:hypothetical protein